MKLSHFGFIFFDDEPNPWDVIPEIHLSSNGCHVRQWPWFASPGDQSYTGLNYEIVPHGYIY